MLTIRHRSGKLPPRGHAWSSLRLAMMMRIWETRTSDTVATTPSEDQRCLALAVCMTVEFDIGPSERKGPPGDLFEYHLVGCNASVTRMSVQWISLFGHCERKAGDFGEICRREGFCLPREVCFCAYDWLLRRLRNPSSSPPTAQISTSRHRSQDLEAIHSHCDSGTLSPGCLRRSIIRWRKMV